MTAGDNFEADLARLLAAHGRSVEDLAGVRAAPTVADHIEGFLAMLTPNTRRTFATHVIRLRDGIGPVCDQLCEACLDEANRFRCACPCAKCAASRLTVAPQGALRVSPDTYSGEHVRHLAAIARRLAVKAGVVDNRRRAQRGLTTKVADGVGSEETCVAALRSLYKTATAWAGPSAAADVPKPRRLDGGRRPMRDFELLELVHLTATTGNDPRLDELIVDFGIATGVRREGVYTLTVGQLDMTDQMVHLRDKYKRTQPAPVSAELLRRMVRHAIERGGPACDPTSSIYRPDSPVFWARSRGEMKPLTSRRFDTLALRWQQNLDWANAEQVGFHHLRHTMAAFLGSLYGPQYKKRYLRHAEGNVTDIYGACTIEELARAMADLLQFEHPLVHGVAERRRDTFERMGLIERR